MKCAKCGAEFFKTNGSNQRCPGCGEILIDDIPCRQIVGALNVIVSRFGREIYAESGRISSLLDDVLPNAVKEKSIIKNAALIGVADFVLKAANDPDNMSTLLEQGYRFAESNGINSEWRAVVLFVFGYPLGIDTRTKYQISGERNSSKLWGKTMLGRDTVTDEEKDYSGKTIAELTDLSDQGDEAASVELADRYCSGNGIDVDYGKALQFYRRAELNNNPYAQYCIGTMYAGAIGVEHDDEKAYEYYKKSADNGYVIAQFALGEALFLGDGCEKNDSEALYWLQKAEKEYKEDNIYIVLSMVHKDSKDESVRDHKKAFEYMQKAVDLKSEVAYNLIGTYYEAGIGVDQDYANAISYYKLAAENGVEMGYLNLAAFYQMGRGVPKDMKKAILYYQKGAAAGNMYCSNALGMCYKNGDGVSQDYEKAFELFMQSALSGNYAAMFNVGLAYDGGEGVSVDKAEAKKWFVLSAEKEFGKAYFMLGFYAEQGIPDGEPDIETAFEWYLKAAETDEDPWSQWIIGNCRTRGLMNSYVDILEGFEWYLKAAKNGHATSQNNVACEYLKGVIIDQDYDLAVEWFEKAVAQNDQYALDNYGTMLMNGQGVPQDAERAFKMFTESAKQGYIAAKLNLGICYFEGWGTQRDLDASLGYLTEAFEAGNENALEYLEKGFQNKNGKWVKRGIFGHVPAPEGLPDVEEREDCKFGCSDFCEYARMNEEDDTRCYCRRFDMEVFNKKKCPYYEDLLGGLADLLMEDE